MKKLIAAFVAALFSAGAVFAQAPAPLRQGPTLEDTFAVPAQKSETKQADKKSTKRAKKAKKDKQVRKTGKKSPGKKAPKKSVSSAK